MPYMGQEWLAAGNLPRYDGPHAPLLGFPIDRKVFPTRWAEYGFVLEALAFGAWEGPILDAGTGFNPEIHVLSQLLGAMGYPVIASDLKPETLNLPASPTVTRKVDDLTRLSEANDSVGVYVNISVFEHLSTEDRGTAWAEAYRVLKPGGLLLMTMDTRDPTFLQDGASRAGFAIGPTVNVPGAPLTPPVSWLRAQKPWRLCP